MLKFAKFALLAVLLAVGAASPPAFAVSQRTITAGEPLARALVRLMDVDKNGTVSKQEFLQFMAAEFDRLDTDHSGELTMQELIRFPSLGPACICHFGYGGDQCTTSASCFSEGGRCVRSCPTQQ